MQSRSLASRVAAKRWQKILKNICAKTIYYEIEKIKSKILYFCSTILNDE